jgi:hypothetical protein
MDLLTAIQNRIQSTEYKNSPSKGHQLGATERGSWESLPREVDTSSEEAEDQEAKLSSESQSARLPSEPADTKQSDSLPELTESAITLPFTQAGQCTGGCERTPLWCPVTKYVDWQPGPDEVKLPQIVHRDLL